MTILDLAQHPELAVLVATVRTGDVVEIIDHGCPVVRCAPAGPSVRERLESLHASFVSPAYPGDSVVDMRKESR